MIGWDAFFAPLHSTIGSHLRQVLCFNWDCKLRNFCILFMKLKTEFFLNNGFWTGFAFSITIHCTINRNLMFPDCHHVLQMRKRVEYFITGHLQLVLSFKLVCIYTSVYSTAILNHNFAYSIFFTWASFIRPSVQAHFTKRQRSSFCEMLLCEYTGVCKTKAHYINQDPLLGHWACHNMCTLLFFQGFMDAGL